MLLWTISVMLSVLIAVLIRSTWISACVGLVGGVLLGAVIWILVATALLGYSSGPPCWNDVQGALKLIAIGCKR